VLGVNNMYIDINKNNKIASYDIDRIEDVTKKYLASSADILQKKEFLRLKNEYYKVKKIENYSTVQKKLYKGKNKSEIIAFELFRILQHVGNRSLELDPVINIKRILFSAKGEITEEVYYSLVRSIIKCEVALGIRVGLFEELCVLFEERVNEIELGNIQSLKRK
jgi:hypothetical protein